jgi:acetyl-CoA C-acetyltransferase
MIKDIYIVSAVRTPIGSFNSSLSNIDACHLGGVAIKGAVDKISLEGSHIDEVFMGNVLQGNLGQAPAKQAAIYAGLPTDVPCTTINKVCASGMKSLIFGAQSIMCGDNECVIVGGMENMSQAPHYFNARNSVKFGDVKMTDGIIKDGLTDPFSNIHMGVCADQCAKEFNITRQEQDDFSIESYRRAKVAWDSGKFNDEIVPVEIVQKRGPTIIVDKDEEYLSVKLDKIPGLRPAFSPDGTVTAANASTLNDGASALILMSKEKMEELNLKPLARLVGYADASQTPGKFTTAPALAIPIALKKSGLDISHIDYFELNEAFSVVGIVNAKMLGIPMDKVDVNGGAVALGHPLGSSGSRIIVTLINVLKQNKGRYGVAGICNGGGGASAIVIENMM